MVRCNMAVPHYGNASHNVEWYGAMQQWCNAQRPQCQYGYVAPQQYAGGV